MDQINLPADLPENLKTGQIIPANGSDRGLPIQYGYNYLMQQVNAAQTAYNNLAEALAVLDVADIKQNIMAGEDGEPVSLEALLRSLNENMATKVNKGDILWSGSLNTVDSIITLSAPISALSTNYTHFLFATGSNASGYVGAIETLLSPTGVGHKLRPLIFKNSALDVGALEFSVESDTQLKMLKAHPVSSAANGLRVIVGVSLK